MKTGTTAIIGPAKVFKLIDPIFEITRDSLKRLPIEKGDRVLFRTSNSDVDAEAMHFTRKQICLSVDAAKYLVEKQVSCVGIDYILANHCSNAAEINNLLMNGPVSLIEGLRLGNIEAGEYEMICLPVPATGNTRSQSRVILKPGKMLVEKSCA